MSLDVAEVARLAAMIEGIAAEITDEHGAPTTRLLFDAVSAQLRAAVAEVTVLRRKLAEMTAARNEACELATTHLPEDRQRILELRRVGSR
jgi:hypothetical protein